MRFTSKDYRGVDIELQSLLDLHREFTEAMRLAIIENYNKGKKGWDNSRWLKDRGPENAILEALPDAKAVAIANYAMFWWNADGNLDNRPVPFAPVPIEPQNIYLNSVRGDTTSVPFPEDPEPPRENQSDDRVFFDINGAVRIHEYREGNLITRGPEQRPRIDLSERERLYGRSVYEIYSPNSLRITEAIMDRPLTSQEEINQLPTQEEVDEYLNR